MLPFDLWRSSRLNPYQVAKPFLFRMDAEDAHLFALHVLLKKLGPSFFKSAPADDPILNTSVCGLSFPNPVGLAAGFDKNAEAMSELLALGFGSIEIGTITPRPQPGNPRPRLFRIPEAQAVINRMGFNSDGMDLCLRRIVAWHDSTQPNRRDKEIRGLIGFNIGINKDCADPAADYAAGYKRVAPYAAYVTVNISSPNTPGLRDLQTRETLAALLAQITAARASCAKQPPVFVKIAPDLNDSQIDDVAEVALGANIQGMVVGNTTITRPGSIPAALSQETGGLSGKPLFDLSTQILARMYQRTEGKIPLVGVGGITNGADAYAKIRAGASLVQLYSALIYEGPGLVRRIKRELAALLKRDGFKSVTEAVGKADQ